MHLIYFSRKLILPQTSFPLIMKVNFPVGMKLDKLVKVYSPEN